MTYEPQEIKLRTRVHRMLHRQRQLRANSKEISRKQQKELESLTNQVSLDPMCTIQLRESTVEKLRMLSFDLKGESNSMTYDDLLNHVLCNFDLGSKY